MEDETDVLSLSAHEEWETEESEASVHDLDMEDMVVVDEIGIDEKVECDEPGQCMDVIGESVPVSVTVTGPASPAGAVHREDSPRSSSRALGPVEELGVVSSGRSRIRSCYVCGWETREKMRRHVLKSNLPWFWSPATACWDCGVQALQASSVALKHTHDPP